MAPPARPGAVRLRVAEDDNEENAAAAPPQRRLLTSATSRPARATAPPPTASIAAAARGRSAPAVRLTLDDSDEELWAADRRASDRTTGRTTSSRQPAAAAPAPASTWLPRSNTDWDDDYGTNEKKYGIVNEKKYGKYDYPAEEDAFSGKVSVRVKDLYGFDHDDLYSDRYDMFDLAGEGKGSNLGVEGEEGEQDEVDEAEEEAARVKKSQKQEVVWTAERPYRRNQWVICALSSGLVLLLLGLWTWRYIKYCLDDGRWFRCLHFLAFPFIAFFMAFACNILFLSIINTFGPVAHIEKNSKYYSSIAPPPYSGPDPLPMITVQMPVYKEGFSVVLQPTLESVMQATRRYEEQGGRVNIFINDDGLMVVPRKERNRRIAYYRMHNIGFVARPAEGRKGRFKKASNMNFCLHTSQRVMARTEQLGGVAYMGQALHDVLEESNHSFMMGGDVRVGEYILLIDSDTRIPEDCMLPSVTELMMSPEVAFTQHLTSPMQIVGDYWENAIAHFTNTIYKVAVVVACSGGDPAPLVGHNAFLRWTALQEVEWQEDGVTKYWSESHVSEDFDMALRLQSHGYIGRYITFTGPNFKEGLSLTVHDEITRFQKYAFGSSEMIFNPISQWLYRGPISPVIRRFLACKQVPLFYKYNLFGYLGTYFAMATAPFAALFNYFMWQFSYNTLWPTEVIHTIDIVLFSLILFGFICPLTLAILKYRLSHTSLLRGILTEFQHTLALMMFFTGIGYHLQNAVIAHLFQSKMEWSSTVKELKKSNFFQEVKVTVAGYKWMYIHIIFWLIVIGGMWNVPIPYQIRSVYAIAPLAILLIGHALLPVVLNPVLMKVKF
eukprot:jgi/Chlat1/6713/Chrsp50S06422